jgi:hypothetical protein
VFCRAAFVEKRRKHFHAVTVSASTSMMMMTVTSVIEDRTDRTKALQVFPAGLLGDTNAPV